MNLYSNKVRFLLTELQLICLITAVVHNVDPPRNSGFVYGEKCVWSAQGGNMSTAKEICNRAGGSVVTFNNMIEAKEMLDLLNIANDMPIFIGAIRTRNNNSLYFDWLSRPGTWSHDIDVDVTTDCISDGSDENDCICIKLLEKSLSLVNCSAIMPYTVCESDDVSSCLIQQFTPHMPLAKDEVTNPKEDNITSDTPSYVSNSSRDAHDMDELFQVPGRNGSRWTDFSSLLSEIINSANLSNIFTELTTKSAPTKGVDMSELILLPGENGTRVSNFSSLLSEIIGKTDFSLVAKPNMAGHGNGNQTSGNQTTVSEVSTLNFLTGNSSNMTGSQTGSENQTDEIEKLTNFFNSVPIREAFFQTATDSKLHPSLFQISGINCGAPAHWSPGMYPPLLIDSHVTTSACLQETTKALKELKQTEIADNDTLKSFGVTVDNIANKDISMETDDLKRDLFSDIMFVGEDLIKKIPASTREMFVSTDNIEIFSRVMNPTFMSPDDHVDFNQPHDTTHIQLSKQIFKDAEQLAFSGVRVSTITYKKMDRLDNMLRASNEHISSPVVSVTVNFVKGNITEEKKNFMESAIKFTMQTDIDQFRQEEKRRCTYWDFVAREWSTKGCHVTSKTSSNTTCECNHLTNFAILVMYVENQDISVEGQQALFTLTTVGCSLSIACLIMTLICYIYLRMLSREKIMIHANLCLALLLAQVVFVSSHDAHTNPIACKIVAVLLHFLFMASFTWMMVEGIALYLCCTKGIFHHRDMRTKYFLLGWGLPLVIVVVSLASRFPDYGNGPQYSCWLSIRDGLIWAFLGPLLVIVVMNIGVMGLVVKAFLTLKLTSEKSNVARLRGSLRAMLTLLPLLGLTWLLSLLVPYSVVFNYFFVIANTVQGMCIFFLHCICNEEIRKKFYEKRRRWSTTRTGSDAEMTFPSRRKTGSFDAINAIKVTATSTPQPAEYASRTAWT